MPIVIPPFTQYQQALFPLRGLWNHTPPEGDRFVNAEIAWQSSGVGGAVQFALSGNSPVAFSQIVALSVDNSRNGADVDFLFPDSGFVLTVPAYNQGVYPVYTNALTFFAISAASASGGMTILQVLNSQPPPISIQPSQAQQQASVLSVLLTTAATTPIVPAGISGTLAGFSITVNAAVTGTAGVLLVDGTGRVLWVDAMTYIADQPQMFNLSGLKLRFTNGLSVVISNPTGTGSAVISINVYYSTP